MKQTQLDRAVADATGETRETIRHRGFTLLEPADVVSVPPLPDISRPRCTPTDSDGQPDAIDPVSPTHSSAV